MSSSAAKKIQKVVRGRKGRTDAKEKKQQKDMQYELNRQREIDLSRYSDMYGYTSSWKPRHQVNKRINWKAIALQCLSTMKSDSQSQTPMSRKRTVASSKRTAASKPTQKSWYNDWVYHMG